MKFINSDEDMKWLRDVHIKDLPANVKSAILYGNEDFPDKIEVFEYKDAISGDPSTVYLPNSEGKFEFYANLI